MTVLVTGGTGTLGRPTVDRLITAGHDVRVLSRSPGPGRVLGDLATGAGLTAALDGVLTVAHLALGARHEASYTQRVVDEATRAGVQHLFYISIVGADQIAMPYYRQKVASERIVQESGLPFTILRATQFHDLVASLMRAQRHLPVRLSLRGVSLQPIEVTEVAERVAGLLADAPAGRVPDLGGPEHLTLDRLVAIWQGERGTRRPVWHLPVRGRMVNALREGHQLTSLPGGGHRTFAEYAEHRTSEDG